MLKKAILFLIVFVILAHVSAGRAEQVGLFARGETVVVVGEALSPFFGTPPERLSLFAMTSSGFEPVPFQIDQRFRKRNRVVYAYTGGKQARPDPDPNLDSLDELVFWSGDAGPRVPGDGWPASSRGIEIILEDPVTGGRGYVYLLAFPGIAPVTERRHVRYDPETDSVHALYYNITFSDKYKLEFVDLSITPEAGGTGEDIVDQAKYRVYVLAGGTIISYELDRNQVHSRVRAWIDGPVRVRRKTANYVELWMWLGSSSNAVSVFGPSGFSIEVPVIGGTPIKGLTNLSTRWTLELNRNAVGMTFRSDKNPEGVEIDGMMSDAERGMDFSHQDWMIISGDHGALLRRAGKLSERPTYIDLYYMDDSGIEEKPEEEPGQIGASGYYIPFAGRRGFKFQENIVEFFLVLPGFLPGDENACQERASRPIKITVKDATFSNPPLAGPAEWPPPRKHRKDSPAPTYTYVGSEAEEIMSQVLPVIVMSSDNGFGGGLMYVHANPLNTRIRLTTQAWYTIKSYSVMELILGEEVPREGSNWAWISHARYRVRPGRDFYGLGNDSDRDNQTNFFNETLFWKLWVNRNVWGPVWVGALAQFNHEFAGHGEGDWSPDTFDPNWFPELVGKGTWWTNRIGAFISHDTRNSHYIPTEGGFRKLQYYNVPHWLGSDFSFEYWYLDVRQFIHLRKPRKDVLAIRWQAMHAVGGPIPFYELAIAGSEYTVRGYFNGRFRDRDMTSINIEWRHKLWKIFDIHFFQDFGAVFNDILDREEFLTTEFHNASGTGFRITIPPNIVMRGDFGSSDTDLVFYFNWGQTF